MKLKKISGVLVAAMVLSSSFGWTSYATTKGQSVSTTTDQSGTKRYIIKFKAKSTNGNQIVSKYNGKFRRQFKNVDAAVADITAQNLAKIKSDPNVAYVEEDHVVKVAATSTSTQTNWGVTDIGAPDSWQSGLTGKGIKVAVIDTGVATHSDLAVAGGTNVISGAGTTSYADDNGHGTHVVGIIGAKGIDGGVEGVAPDASIYAVKALDSTGSGYTSDIISGIDWAIDNKMDIISMSLGSNQSDMSLQNAVDTAYNSGILVVAAAGNDGSTDGSGTSIDYPANYSSVIAVGAVDSSNTRAYFSSTGSKLEVSAPGVNVLSTYLNGGYAQMSGTSMATPFVAGDLALLKQKYPAYTNVQLRNLLDSGTVDLGTSGRDSLYGYGLIKAPTGTSQVVMPSTPVANVASGSYTSAQTITLTDSTPGVSIYYTLDGTTPTASSSLYTSPITISSTATVKAVAIDSNGNTSSLLSNTYTIIAPVVLPAKPVATIPTGTYNSAISVALSDKTTGVSIYYTVDGSMPTAKSNLYSTPITIGATATLKAVAIDSKGNASEVLTVNYKINTAITIPTPTASVPSGTYKAPLFVQLYSKYPGYLKAYYTLDGSTPTTKSIPYAGFISINSSCTLKVITVDIYGNTSGVLSNQYTIIKPPANPIISQRSGAYKVAQTVTLSDSTQGVSIYYTLDGTVPSAKSNLYTGAITIKSTATLRAIAIDKGGITSNIVSETYIIRK
jgi:minor extracellular protease Epr